jgi:hypothetical protein
MSRAGRRLFQRALLDAAEAALRVVGEAALLPELAVVDDREAERRLPADDVVHHAGNRGGERRLVLWQLEARTHRLQRIGAGEGADVRGEHRESRESRGNREQRKQRALRLFHTEITEDRERKVTPESLSSVRSV